MNFAEQYEILELLTSGRVSTFRARERTTREQVLLLSFECSATDPLPSSTTSVLARFASLAPSPPGIVLKAGLDEESSSAYLVTRLPEPPALQEWVRAYRSNLKAEIHQPGPDATVELSSSEVQSALGQRGRVQPEQPLATVESGGNTTETFSIPEVPSAPRSGGEFTRLFQELGAFQPPLGQSQRSKPASPVNPSPPNPLANLSIGKEAVETRADTGPTPRSDPGPFTQQFFSESKSKFDSANSGKDATTLEPPVTKEPGVFTKQFLIGGKDDSAQGTNESASTPSAPMETGVFTRQFFAGGEQTRQDVGAAPRESPGEILPDRKNPPPSSSTAFGGRFDSGSSDPRSSSDRLEGNSASPKESGGEFTSFFRGPFDQPAVPAKPIALPDPSDVKASREKTGDFTRVFGKGTGLELEPLRMVTPEPERQKPQGTFTQIFGNDSDGAAKLGTSRLDTGSFAPPSSTPIPRPPATTPDPSTALPARPPSVSAPLPGSFSAPKSTNIPFGPAEGGIVSRSSRSDATDVFRTLGSDAPPEVHGQPSGPSEFTQFLTLSQVRAALPPEPAGTPPAQNAGMVFPPPAVPQPPPFQFTPPAALKPPFAAPQPPPLPATPKSPAGPGSYWPLITVFTILVAIGALLVMYFVLRH